MNENKISILQICCDSYVGGYFLISCYSKDNFVYKNPYQEKTAENISSENVNQFLSSVRKVDGEAEAKYRMARYFQKKNKHKIAIEELKEVILINPFLAKVYNAMGVSYDQLREFNSAIHSYKLAIKLNPKLDYVYNNLGYSFLLVGDYDRAIDAFRKAIALDEQNKRFRNNLGLAYAKRGAYELALAQFRLTGDEFSANYKLGQILFKEGKYNIARKYNTKSFQSKASNDATPPVSRAGAGKDSQPKIIRKTIRQASEPPQQSEQKAVKRINSNLNPKSVQRGQPENVGISENQISSPKNNKEVNKVSQKESRKNRDLTVEVEIEISNGNGVNGMANRLGN